MLQNYNALLIIYVNKIINLIVLSSFFHYLNTNHLSNSRNITSKSFLKYTQLYVFKVTCPDILEANLPAPDFS